MRISRSLAAGVCALVLSAVGSAQAGGTSSVVMFGESGDYIASGLRTYEGHKQVRLDGSAAGLDIEVNGPTQQFFGFTLEFTPPSDDLLAPGNYSRAERSSFRSKGHPGIDIGGDGRGCNMTTGRFVIKDLGLGKGGKVDRVWLLFEQHCEGGTPALFGEVKVGIPSKPGRARALPSAIRWPKQRIRAHGTTVPITFVARHTLRAGRARLSGAGRGAFHITADQCRGHKLGVRDRCQVYVRFSPRHRNTARATLALGGGGTSARVSLDGTGR